MAHTTLGPPALATCALIGRAVAPTQEMQNLEVLIRRGGEAVGQPHPEPRGDHGQVQSTLRRAKPSQQRMVSSPGPSKGSVGNVCTAVRVVADLASGKPGICCFLMASHFSEERLPI